MANKIRREEIGGEGIHVRDSYVWMEIFYLDSLSDYREHLPQDSHRKPDDSPLRSARDCFCSSMIGDARGVGSSRYRDFDHSVFL